MSTITVIGATATYNFSGTLSQIDLTDLAMVTGQTGVYNYTGIVGVIDLTVPTTINPKNIIRVNRNSNIIRVR